MDTTKITDLLDSDIVKGVDLMFTSLSIFIARPISHGFRLKKCYDAYKKYQDHKGTDKAPEYKKEFEKCKGDNVIHLVIFGLQMSNYGLKVADTNPIIFIPIFFGISYQSPVRTTLLIFIIILQFASNSRDVAGDYSINNEGPSSNLEESNHNQVSGGLDK
ncbi:hypothetical protein [Wolbachia endosymbiont of Ctenocephalides felis wCfeT]|uniref:hypothetical protein n=1 Tax=Wolbachia endosymbiont of Ctenocephalides felis wCfeT TaxID=2732593 RepID=UPI0014459988|nr:hypothetical protein [Wolbachia endosymbiont of Ctenocephalides felis wCfeT]